MLEKGGMMNRSTWAVLVIAGLSLTGSVAATEINPQAERLAAAIDQLDVEHHWPAGMHVSWTTGIPDGRPESGSGKHTHCSAFVAAAAKRVGIYILRPPEHQQLLLANAQYDWLASGAGASQGWEPVPNAAIAQDKANHGWFVVAAYRNHHDNKPGHIAIVRPSGKGPTALLQDGPQITQAGSTNYRSTTLREGFAGHPAAWAHNEVLYFAHAVDPAALDSRSQ
jgi:hypothetical protein